MERAEYTRMFEAEERHFWYRGLRRHLDHALSRHALPADAALLDAGCGSGGNLALLGRHTPRALGIDRSLEAIALCRQRGLPDARGRHGAPALPRCRLRRRPL